MSSLRRRVSVWTGMFIEGWDGRKRQIHGAPYLVREQCCGGLETSLFTLSSSSQLSVLSLYFDGKLEENIIQLCANNFTVSNPISSTWMAPHSGPLSQVPVVITQWFTRVNARERKRDGTREQNERGIPSQLYTWMHSTQPPCTMLVQKKH